MEPNFLALVLEFNANGDLFQFIKAVTIHHYVKAKLLWDISKGVNYLHWLPKQIIHNDLKASNILVSHDVTAKISDFGMADWKSYTTKLFHAQPQVKYLRGATSTHMSPERWRNINECNTECDVYSYGILIWEIYSEKVPFARANNDLIKSAVTDGQRPDENLLPMDMPSEISELMRRCWHHKPRKRPTMCILAQKLQHLLSHNDEIKSTLVKITAQIIQTLQVNGNEKNNLFLPQSNANNNGNELVQVIPLFQDEELVYFDNGVSFINIFKINSF